MTSLVRAYDTPLTPFGEAQRRGWVELMQPAVELAKAIATTDFVPRGMRNNAPAIAAAILYGDEVGLGPMQSLSKIHVIEGRPMVAAEAQRALVLAAGHELWLDELTATRATWCGRRSGSDQVTRVTWTLDDARRAKLAGKDAWTRYPRQMLSARASAELVRAVFADVVGGLAAIEEHDDDVPAPDGNGTNPTGSGAKRKRKRPALAAEGPTQNPPARASEPLDLPPLPDDVAPARDLPAEQADVDARVQAANARLHAEHEQRTLDGLPDPTVSSVQKRRMFALMHARGVDDRGDRLRLTSATLGRVVVSWNELTQPEADRMLDYLESVPEPDPSAVESEPAEPDDDGSHP